MQFSRWQAWLTNFGICSLVLVATSLTAKAQFKTIGPAPFPPAVARERLRTLLAKVDPGNSSETTAKLSDLLVWYRDIIDEELIQAWRRDARENLMEVVESLADSRVAVAVVNFSWREQRQAAFDLANAPMLGRLMARFPESAQPFLDDLLRRPPPGLPEAQAEAVCRILMDMPEIGTWRSSALQILPHYREAAENLLAQDAHSGDKEKRFQALRWENDLNLDVPEAASGPSIARGRPNRAANRDGTAVVLSPPPEADAASAPIAKSSPPAHVPARPALIRSAPPAEATVTAPPAAPSSLPARPPVSSAPVLPAPVVSATQYEGPRSGTLESTGGAIPQNAEYVFRNLPPVKIQLEYNTKIWEARLAAGEGQTQRLIVRNKSSGPQKQCVVHWSVVQ